MNPGFSTEQRRRTLRARFSVRLRKLRIHRGMTQSELADAIDVTPSHISRFEAGISEPTVTQAVLITDRLQCWMVDLIVPPDARLPPIRQHARIDDESTAKFYGEHY